MDIWTPNSLAPPQALRAATLAAYIAFIAVNVASAVGLLGATNAEVSSKFPVPLTPAGWAFSIWGLIFLLQGWGAVYQFLPFGYDADGFKARFANATGVSWIVSWLACCAWQFAFVQQTPHGMWLAALLIFAGFAAMGRAQLALYHVKDRFGPAPSLPLYCAFFLSTTVACAWLSVAASVQLLIALKLSFGPHLDVAAVLAAAAFTCVGAWALLREHDTAYGLTLVWALVAVYEQTDAPGVRRAALGAIVLLAVLSIASVLRGPGRQPQHGPSADAEARQPLRPSLDEP